ncbi:hypothetical protein CRE_28829 [Caenorhabditis remanei]|uniref:Uncharacterized protein n=1 Tax=Caenorhabditis remanei TaxID=31234 RepID=E3MXJ1_CAERE|nr:hypothetical protein CRE_28829 [Caenorhabditis remanei]
MKALIPVLLAFCLLQVITADIFCNEKGNCIGDGKPSGDTRCGNCHSCTYKDCCHLKFTNPYSTCKKKGWTSDEYKFAHGIFKLNIENLTTSTYPSNSSA